MTVFGPDMKVRLPLVLRRQIEEAASANRRTMNAEVIARLEASFRNPEPPDPDSIRAELELLSERVRRLEAKVLP